MTELPQIDAFHAMTIGHRAFELQEAGRDILHMEYGQPSARPPATVTAAAAAMLEKGVPGYWLSQRLREGIAATYRPAQISPDRISLTAGASPALVLALTTRFAPGARIAMTRPGYVSHRNVVKGLHMEAIELPCDASTRFQLTAERLAALDPAPDGVIISSPANPTGSIIPAPELEKIVALCKDRGITIVSDEIYTDLSYGERAASVTEFTDNAFVIGSFSKFYLMPGWRLGWLAAPSAWAARANAILTNFFLTPPSVSQAAGLAALSCTEELATHLDVYRRNRARLLEALPEMGLTDLAPPDGAFYVYARTDGVSRDSRELCLSLLEDTGVATASGVDFDPVEGHKFMRLSFAVTEVEVEEAISRLRAWFAAH